MKIQNSVQNMFCTQIVSFCGHSKQFIYTTSSEPAINRLLIQKNNLLSYCGLVDARLSASEKNLPVPSPTYLALELFISI